MKINKNIVLVLFMVFSAGLFAQGNWKDGKLKEMHERKWQFLVEQVGLSPSEIELVKPVFFEYENAIWSQHEKNREFFRSAMQNDKNVKPNYAVLNDHYSEIELIQGQLFKNYHLKLKKLLKPETLFNYYKAEREFKQKLLQNLPNRTTHRPDDDNP